VPQKGPKPEASALCGAWCKCVIARVWQDKLDSYWGSVVTGLASAFFSKSVAKPSGVLSVATVAQVHDDDVS
jgi:hypothetical protein